MIFKEMLHIKVYYFILIHMLSHYRSFWIKFKMNFSIFCHSNQPTSSKFWTSKVHYYSHMNFLSINNNTNIFIIELLFYIQLPINRFKNILFTICFWTRGTNKKYNCDTKSESLYFAFTPTTSCQDVAQNENIYGEKRPKYIYISPFPWKNENA
jgi:hypothetical protein